jgi:hypothetical protein
LQRWWGFITSRESLKPFFLTGLNMTSFKKSFMVYPSAGATVAAGWSATTAVPYVAAAVTAAAVYAVETGLRMTAFHTREHEVGGNKHVT